nr:MAG: major capsid protein [Microvirus sp.]
MKRKKSIMAHDFSRVPQIKHPRSQFDRSHKKLTTMDAGDLVPQFVDEVLPGDTLNLDQTIFGRLATPIHPTMDSLFMDTFYFFVPNRLVWENWQKFCGEQDNPGDSTDFTIPTVTSSANTYTGAGTNWDYLGLPIDLVPDDNPVSALPFRALALCYNEWFRDENLLDAWFVARDDGPDNLNAVDNGSGRVPSLPFKRGKRFDYFTSCLTRPQKGDSVNLPLGTSAPIRGIGLDVADTGSTSGPITVRETDGPPTSVFEDYWTSGDLNLRFQAEPGNTSYPLIEADLTEATSATINEFRQAIQVQALLEIDNRGGTRYTEIVRAHFGVTSPDARLQRPEYLGGGHGRVGIVPVQQTSETSATPQGNLSGYGTVTSHNNGFTKSFTEHGYVIGFVSVRADLTYQQGINRMWQRQTRYDYYWPSLSVIGDQAVLNSEIFAQGIPATDDLPFGYQERYAEMRYKPSEVTGLFRSAASATLDSWHYCQDFATLPALDGDFIEEDPPVDRTIAVTTEPHLIMDIYSKYICARPIPVNGKPASFNRF